jgi:hypothetical protein
VKCEVVACQGECIWVDEICLVLDTTHLDLNF